MEAEHYVNELDSTEHVLFTMTLDEMKVLRWELSLLSVNTECPLSPALSALLVCTDDI